MNIEWIPVTERLPKIPSREFTSKPLLYVVDGKVVAGRYHINGCFYASDSKDKMGKTIQVSSRFGAGLSDIGLVTHWMYLPKPPKEPQDV